MLSVIDHLQVNVPFRMLKETYLPFFIQHRINPEIGLDVISLTRYSRADFEQIAAELHKHSLSITLHAPFMDLSAGSPDPEVRAITRRRINQAVALIPIFKPKSMVCHAGYEYRRYHFMRSEWLEQSIDFWWWVADAVSSGGSRLMLENVFERDPHEMVDLLEPLKDKRVGLCLDTGHVSAFSQTSLQDWITIVGSYIGQCHLHDNHGEQDAHLALGQGAIDFSPLFDFLSHPGSQGPILTLEPHRQEDFWLSLAYLEKFWSTSRPFKKI